MKTTTEIEIVWEIWHLISRVNDLIWDLYENEFMYILEKNEYGYYKKGYDYHPGWNKRHPKPKYILRDRYRRYREVPKFRYLYDRPTPRKGNIIGFKVNESDFKIAVVVKNRR
jgi:hypothetical protein